MKSIIILSLKKICRTNQIVLLFLTMVYLFLLYIALYSREFKSFVINLNLALSYGCLLLTGGQLKDEMSNGYLDIILHKISRAKVVIGKFLSIISFAFICYLFSLLSLSVLFFLNLNFEEFKSLLIIVAKGFIVTLYLISVGLFLSLYFKGYFNFVIVFFLEFVFLVLIEHLDIISRLDSYDRISDINFFFISLLSPHLIYSRTNIFVVVGLFVLSIFLFFSTASIFERMEFVKK